MASSDDRPTPLSIDAQDEDVRIAAAALKDMRHGSDTIDDDGVSNRIVLAPLSSGRQRSGHSYHPSNTPSLLSLASTSATSVSFDASSRDPTAPKRSTSPGSPTTSSVSPLGANASTTTLTSEPVVPNSAPEQSRFPFVTTARRAYDFSKNNSRVVKFGAEMVESSIQSISRPVIDRLPGVVVDRLGYGRSNTATPNTDEMQIDPVAAERGRAEFKRLTGERTESWSRQTRATLRDEEEDDDDNPPGQRGRARYSEERSGDRMDIVEQSRERDQRQVATRSAWQTMFLEAGGISAAMSEESMKRLRYCLQCLHYATTNLDNQIKILQVFIASVDSTVTGEPVPENAMVSPEALRQYLNVKKNVVDTIRQVVDVIGRYAGGALPEPAKATVKNLILALPGRWSTAVRGDAEWEEDPASPGSTTGGDTTGSKRKRPSRLSESAVSVHNISAGSSSASLVAGTSANGGVSMAPLDANGKKGRKALPPPTAGAARMAAHKVLTLATESLHAVRGVTGVFKETLDRADIWLDRFRMVGYGRGGIDPDPSLRLPPISTESPAERKRRAKEELRLAQSIPSIGPYGPYGGGESREGTPPPTSPSVRSVITNGEDGGSSKRPGDSFPFHNPAPDSMGSPAADSPSRTNWLGRVGSVPTLSPGISDMRTRTKANGRQLPVQASAPNVIGNSARQPDDMMIGVVSPTTDDGTQPPSTPGSAPIAEHARDSTDGYEDEDEDMDQDDGLEHRARKRRRIRADEGDVA